MRMRTLIPVLVIFGVSLAYAADKSGTGDAKAAFERLKSLAGTWRSTSDKSHSKVSYEVMASGNAVVERFSEPSMPAGSEMLTVYYLDGNRLLLSHYCMAGNHPRMEAKQLGDKVLDFDLVDAANLASPNDGHMHHVRYEFLDANDFSVQWTFVKGGKPAFTESTTYTRVQ